MAFLADPKRAQTLRNQCGRHLDSKRFFDVVSALEMLVADAVIAASRRNEAASYAAADAIAADIRNIIRERFAATGKGH